MKAEGLQQNPVTFVRVLNASASVGALEEGRHAHKQLIQSGCKSDVFVDHSLIDKYAKCGSMEDASRVFNKMTTCDMLSWSAMLFGLLKSGSSTKTHWNYFEKCNRKGCTSPPSHLGGGTECLCQCRST